MLARPPDLQQCYCRRSNSGHPTPPPVLESPPSRLTLSMRSCLSVRPPLPLKLLSNVNVALPTVCWLLCKNSTPEPANVLALSVPFVFTPITVGAVAELLVAEIALPVVPIVVVVTVKPVVNAEIVSPSSGRRSPHPSRSLQLSSQ